MKKIMLKYLFIHALAFSSFILINLQANEIRLYQESDHKVLSAMLANNEELLVLGNDFTTRVSETARYLNSKNYTTQVYIKNNEPIGFITYCKEGFLAPIIDIQNFDPKKELVSVLHSVIQLFFVQEEYRRQSIGTALLKTVLADLQSKNIKSIILQTKVANIASRSLYEKFGFKLCMPIAPGIADCLYRLLL